MFQMWPFVKKASRTIPQGSAAKRPHQRIYNPAKGTDIAAQMSSLKPHNSDNPKDKESSEDGYMSTKTSMDVKEPMEPNSAWGNMPEQASTSKQASFQESGSTMTDVEDNKLYLSNSDKKIGKIDEIVEDFENKMEDSPSRHLDTDYEDRIDEGVEGKGSKNSKRYLRMISYKSLRERWLTKQSNSQMKLNWRRQVGDLQKEFDEKERGRHNSMVMKIGGLEREIGVARKQKEREEVALQEWLKVKRKEFTVAVYGRLTEEEFCKLNIEMANGENIKRKKVVKERVEGYLKDKYNEELKGKLGELTKEKLRHYAQEISLRKKMQDEVVEHQKWAQEEKKVMMAKVKTTRMSLEKKIGETFENNSVFVGSGLSEENVESSSKESRYVSSENLKKASVLCVVSSGADVVSHSTSHKDDENDAKDDEDDAKDDEELEEGADKIEEVLEEKEHVEVSDVLNGKGTDDDVVEVIVSEKSLKNDKILEESEMYALYEQERIDREVETEKKLCEEVGEAADGVIEDNLEWNELKRVNVMENFIEVAPESSWKMEQESESRDKLQTTESQERGEAKDTSASETLSDDVAESAENRSSSEGDEESDVKDSEEDIQIQKPSFKDLLKMSRSEGKSRHMLDLAPRMNLFTKLIPHRPNLYLPDPSNEEELRILIPSPHEHLFLYNNLLLKLFFKRRSYKLVNLDVLASKRHSFVRSSRTMKVKQLRLSRNIKSLQMYSEKKKRTELYKSKMLNKLESEMNDLRLHALKSQKMAEFFNEATEMLLDSYQTDVECLTKAHNVIKATGVRSIERLKKKRFLKKFASQSHQNKRFFDRLESAKMFNETLSNSMSLLTDTHFIKKSIQNLS